MTRVIVLAQGTGRRWDTGRGPYLGAPKHLAVRVDGEPVLARTVRLLRDLAPELEVVVLGPDRAEYRAVTAGARYVTADDPDPLGCDMSKFAVSAPWWSPDGRTILLWGDVFYTSTTLESVLRHDDDRYHVWRRPGPSTVTGHRWDESFAVSFGPADHARVLEVAHQVAGEVHAGRIKSSHIRTHLAAWCGLDGRRLDSVQAVASVGHQTHVDDWTDDVDTPAEWRAFMGRWHEGGYRAAVVTPWVEGDEWRGWSRAFTHDRLTRLSLPIYYGAAVGPHGVNRSAARNAAARAAIADGAQVLILADADTYVAPDQLWAAVHLAAESGQLIRAFTEYRKLERTTTRRLLHGPPPMRERASRTMLNHSSGMCAIRADRFVEVGGFDERFPSWGAEDRAFWLTCNTLLGWPWDIDGPAKHLWHPHSPERDATLPQYQANVELGMRYKRAAGVVEQTGILPELERVRFTPCAEPDPDALRAILAEPGGPLDPDLVPAGELTTPADPPPPPSARGRNGLLLTDAARDARAARAAAREARRRKEQPA